MLKRSIEQLMQRRSLDQRTCKEVFNELLDQETNPLQVAAFLILFRAKPETVNELIDLVNYLRSKMIRIPTKSRVLDIVGTGGDGANTINISTGSAILAASCGVKVAKHGNRAISSLTGSADVLEALGVKIDLNAKKLSACIEEIGIGFCFSPLFHPALTHLRSLRKQLNLPTTFNLLGPLLNPASPAHLLLGVYDPSLIGLFSAILTQTKTKHSVVYHGNGLDEISCLGPTLLCEIKEEVVRELSIDPLEFGLLRCDLKCLQGHDAHTNSQLLSTILSGKASDHAIAETFILNAAVAMYVYGLFPSIDEALPYAKDNLASGAPFHLLKKWIEFSHD